MSENSGCTKQEKMGHQTDFWWKDCRKSPRIRLRRMEAKIVPFWTLFLLHNSGKDVFPNIYLNHDTVPKELIGYLWIIRASVFGEVVFRAVDPESASRSDWPFVCEITWEALISCLFQRLWSHLGWSHSSFLPICKMLFATRGCYWPWMAQSSESSCIRWFLTNKSVSIEHRSLLNDVIRTMGHWAGWGQN